MTELYLKHRPKRLKDIVGQTNAVQVLETALANGGVPHALLFTGPSGTGKTTLARILKTRLRCSDGDFCEMNCADTRSIDDIRSIRSRMHLASIGGKSRIYYIDEVHGLLGPSQDAMLKMLEDTPKHVYFFLATTDPHKLKRTIRTRCTTINLQPLSNKDLIKLLNQVLEKENTKVSKEVIERIIDCADGSAREALVILNKVYQIEDEESQLENIVSSATKDKSIELCRALIFKKPWAKVAEILKAVEGEEPEKLRRMILSYARTILLGNQKKFQGRAAYVIECMRDALYDSGHPGLAACCWDILQAK